MKNAVLYLLGGEDDVCEVSPSDFLKLDMHQKVIETLLLPKLDDREYVRTYKVMPRSQVGGKSKNLQ